MTGMKAVALGLGTMLLSATAYAGPPGLKVLAATNDLAGIARAVGGELLEIDVVARPDRDLHTLEVRPSTMRKAAKADIYLEVGLSLDQWSLDIVRGSRNRHLDVVRCSDAITPEEVPQGRIDASMGDVHPEGNPHYWLDPENGVAVARFLAKEFAEADPAHAADYEAGAERFANEVESRMADWDQRLRGAVFVEYHKMWIYLAERFGMEIAGQVEPLPGIPPSAHDLADLAAAIRQRGHLPVVRDVYHDKSLVQFLVREAGARPVVLQASCPEPTSASYLSTFDLAAKLLGRQETGRTP
ncbi:metal ABC transporter substrate-binding protein [bacterium]|nr:metal ABC transporter substrate-binding protein [bacterium]